MMARQQGPRSAPLTGIICGVVRRVGRLTCAGYAQMKTHLEGAIGLEIGGPSAIFRKGRLIPVYDCCQSIDNCNFSHYTIWSQDRESSLFGPRLGRQFVAEATQLNGIANGHYDFVLASHVLEHVANPLRALQEWNRVLKDKGVLLVIVPDKRRNFDHRRPFTKFDHVESDYLSNKREDDLTHLDEILSLHDLELDRLAGSPHEFRDRCLENGFVRGMHHHVFNPRTLVQMFSWLGMEVLNLTVERPFHIIITAQKSSERDKPWAEAINDEFFERYRQRYAVKQIGLV